MLLKKIGFFLDLSRNEDILIKETKSKNNSDLSFFSTTNLQKKYSTPPKEFEGIMQQNDK